MEKSSCRFLGHQVHVGENHDARDGLLRDLRAPAGFGARIVALAFGKAELEQELDQIDEMLAGAAEGVMVVIAPAQAEPVLPVFLHAPGAVAALPIGALGFKEELAGQVGSDQAEDPVEGLVGGADAFRVGGEQARARPPEFPGLDNARQFTVFERGGDETGVGPAFDGYQLGPAFFRHQDAAITGARFAFRFTREVVASHEIRDRFRPQGQDRGALLVALAEDDPRQRGARMFIGRLAGRRFRQRVGHEARLAQGVFFTGIQREVINPFKEVGARLGCHPAGQLAGESVPFQEPGQALAQELLSLISQRPVEALGRVGGGDRVGRRFRDLLKLAVVDHNTSGTRIIYSRRPATGSPQAGSAGRHS